MAKKKQRIKALLRFIQYCLLITALILFIAPSIGGINIVQAQEPECPPGFDWHRMSGVGCVQANCREISNAKLSYTSACICHDGYKGCYEPVDTEGINCGAHCPVSRLIACVDPEALCPGEEPPPIQDQLELKPDQPPQSETEDRLLAITDQDPDQPITALSDLYHDLELFLAGEGITIPTPGQIAVTGSALATLLAGWLLLNLISGTPAETSLQVINAWRRGQPPADTPIKPISPPQEITRSDQTQINTDTISPPPSEVVRDYHLPSSTPIGETAEERVLRTTREIIDIDDAVKQTRRDFEAFQQQVPDSIRNSEEWQTYVQPRLDQITSLVKRTELDTGRTWLERLDQLISIREEIESDLRHLPQDSREAIIGMERILRTLGHFPTDAYRRIVIDPAKNAGRAVLPEAYAERWTDMMEELDEGLSQTAQGIAELPRRGAEVIRPRQLYENAEGALDPEDWAAFGPQDVPVEHFDWMRSPRNVRRIINNLLGRSND